MNDEAHIEENRGTAGDALPDSLTPEEKSLVKRAAARYREIMKVNCSGCGYCMPCPAGVDIPGLMNLLNKVAFDGSTFGLRQRYPHFPEENNASHCTQCGHCESVCPQHIPIMATLEKLVADTAPAAD